MQLKRNLRESRSHLAVSPRNHFCRCWDASISRSASNCASISFSWLSKERSWENFSWASLLMNGRLEEFWSQHFMIFFIIICALFAHVKNTKQYKSYLLSCLTPSTQHRSAGFLSLSVRLRLRRGGNERRPCSSDMVLLRGAVHATHGRGRKFHGAAPATDKGSLFIKGINKQGRENDMSTLYWHNAPPAPAPHLSPPLTLISLQFLSCVVSKVSDGEALAN